MQTLSEPQSAPRWPLYLVAGIFGIGIILGCLIYTTQALLRVVALSQHFTGPEPAQIERVTSAPLSVPPVPLAPVVQTKPVPKTKPAPSVPVEMGHVPMDQIKREVVESRLAPAVAPPAAPLSENSSPEDLAAAVSHALKTIRKMDDFTKIEITNLILEDRCDDFEARSKEYETNFAADPLYEAPLLKLYESIDSNNPELSERLDTWVKTRGSYAAVTARAMFRIGRIGLLRGSKSDAQLLPEELAAINRYRVGATSDVHRAIAENKGFVPAYYALLLIDRSVGNAETTRNDYARAIGVTPESYFLRHVYLSTLTPKRGGSYKLMYEFTKDIAKLAELNPRLWSLKGDISEEKAKTAWQASELATALRYYNEAMTFGDRLSVLKNRGRLYYSIKDYQSALRDFTTYQEYDFHDQEVNAWVAAMVAQTTK